MKVFARLRRSAAVGTKESREIDAKSAEKLGKSGFCAYIREVFPGRFETPSDSEAASGIS
jgi:hypothetical protein